MNSQTPAGPGDQPRPDDQHFHHAPDQTELQRYLSLALKKVEPYVVQIVVALVVIAVVVAGSIIWARMAEGQRKAAWQGFVEARAPEDYLAVADQHSGTPVGQWARLQAGRGFLQEGLNLAMIDRSASDERLRQAQETFDQLLQERLPREVREGALFGMATVLEALSDEDTEAAINAYEQLMQEFPESQYFARAEERVEALRTEEARQFYAWFRQQQPRPVDRTAPRDVQPPTAPFDLDLPLDPDTEAPPLPLQDPAAPADDPAAPPESPTPEEERPASEEERPAPEEERPASEEERPAPEEKSPAAEEERSDPPAADSPPSEPQEENREDGSAPDEND